MTTETEQDTRTNAMKGIKVYTMFRSEKITYAYHVPARSLKEAKKIMDESYTIDGVYVDEYEFKDYDSYQHERYYNSVKADEYYLGHANPRTLDNPSLEDVKGHIDHLMGDH